MDRIVLASPDEQLGLNALFNNRAAYAAQGLAVEFVFTTSGEPVVQAMLDGRTDYTPVCGAPVPAAVAGRGLKMLAAVQTSSFALYAHPEINRLSQLAGKRVVLFGSIPRPNLETALRRHGVAIDTVEVMHSSEAAQRFGRPDYLKWHEMVLDGTVAAISVNAPRSIAARQAGLGCLLRLGDVYPIPTTVLLTTNRRLQERRDEVTRFERALLQSIDDFIRDQPLGTRLLREFHIPEPLIEGTYWEMLSDLHPDPRLPEAVQRRWIEWSKELLGLTEEVPLSRAFDFSIAEEVVLARDHK